MVIPILKQKAPATMIGPGWATSSKTGGENSSHLSCCNLMDRWPARIINAQKVPHQIQFYRRDIFRSCFAGKCLWNLRIPLICTPTHLPQTSYKKSCFIHIQGFFSSLLPWRVSTRKVQMQLAGRL